jgi:hypothetical protein
MYWCPLGLSKREKLLCSFTEFYQPFFLCVWPWHSVLFLDLLKYIEPLVPGLNSPPWLCCSVWYFAYVLSCNCSHSLRSLLILDSDHLPAAPTIQPSVFHLCIHHGNPSKIKQHQMKWEPQAVMSNRLHWSRRFILFFNEMKLGGIVFIYSAHSYSYPLYTNLSWASQDQESI